MDSAIVVVRDSYADRLLVGSAAPLRTISLELRISLLHWFKLRSASESSSLLALSAAKRRLRPTS